MVRRWSVLCFALVGSACVTTRAVDLSAASVGQAAGLAPDAELTVATSDGPQRLTGLTTVRLADPAQNTTYELRLFELRPAGPGSLALPPYDAQSVLAIPEATEARVPTVSLWRSLALGGGVVGATLVVALVFYWANNSACGFIKGCSEPLTARLPVAQ